MPAKSFGQDITKQPVLQPGYFITDEQDYSSKGIAVFVGDLASYPNRPLRGDPHPLDLNCICYSVRSTSIKPNKLQYDCEYIGLSIDPTPYFVEFVGSAGEEPIETHPNFQTVIGGTPAAPLNGATFDTDTGAFLGFPVGSPTNPTDSSQNLSGVLTYYRPSVIVRVSYWTLETPNPAPLGHITEPGTISGLIMPSGCLNLLCTNFGYRQITPAQPPYQITVEYLASGPNGWDTLIYTES